MDRPYGGGSASAQQLPAPVAALARLNGLLLAACRMIAIWLVAVLAAIVIASVVFRYAFNNSLAWSEDAAKFLMVWMTFVAAPLGFKHGAHVAVELLPPGLPASVTRIIRVLVHLIVLFVMAMLTWTGWRFASNGWGQVALTVGDIPMFWIFVCMPVGALVMTLLSLENLARVIVGAPELGAIDEEQISTRGI